VDKNYLTLKRFSQDLGIDLFGVADISEIKKDFNLSQGLGEKFDRAICLGARLSQGILEEIESAPTKLYFHHYRTVNAFLDQVAFKVCNYIQKLGYLSLPIPASQIIDWQNQKAHLSHKKIGYLAGLGWIGRNNLLVNKDLGSQFRLVSILTHMPLKADKPLKKDCGACNLCVTICPVSAIREDPANFGHTECFEKLKEFQKQRLVDQYICGICVKICRGNKI
jgi:epoxyqueuosine reductase QueG